MEKKTLIQLILSILLILTIYLTFLFFYKNDVSKKNTNEIKNVNSLSKDTAEEEQSLIENIKYTSNNNKGDIFEIFAEYGKPNSENPDLMFLTNVKGKITLDGGENIDLVSEFANFNTKTFETTFIDNVKISRSDEMITGNELYLVLDNNENNQNKEENILRMSYNVYFEKPGYSLSADVLEIDLITKDVKIFMNKNLEKVIATSVVK